MRSILDTCGNIFDTRFIYLKGGYFSVSSDQADQLASFFYSSVLNMLRDICVVDWKFNKKKLDNIVFSLQNHKAQNGHYSFGTDAFVKTSQMKNVTDLRNLRRRRSAYVSRNNPDTNPAQSFGKNFGTSSERSMRSIMASSNSHEEAKSKVMELFRLDHIPLANELYGDDFLAHFYCMPMSETGNTLFCGEVYISASVYALEDEVNIWAECFRQLSIDMQSMIGNINISIMINSGREAYSSYYGYENNCLRSRTDNISLYSRLFYLTEIGWMNLICKSTRSVGALPSAAPDLSIGELASGGLIVGSNTNIQDTNIGILKMIKSAIYLFLLPRSRGHLFQHMIIRPLWEIVPVFDNEVKITDKEIVFEHHGMIDVWRLSKQLYLPQ